MERKEVLQARFKKRQPKKLYESDFLLGVFDKHRMRGLRYKTSSSEDFLNNDATQASPPWTRLRDLEEASKHVEEQDERNDSVQLKWVKMLIAPGSSLGGARPKSSVIDENASLWIAKFPSKNDRNDSSMSEKLAHSIAIKSKVTMSEAMTFLAAQVI